MCRVMTMSRLDDASEPFVLLLPSTKIAARSGCCCCGVSTIGDGLAPGLKRSIRHSHLQRTPHALLTPLASNTLSLTSSVHTHAAGRSAECGGCVLRCIARDVIK
jgi:hypothetical protein